jgi:hypothetical protein
MPHTEPRDYYVSLRRAERTALLAGPFETHTEALALVDRAVALANDLDPRAWFDPFGTMSLPRSPANPYGKLNIQLDAMPRVPPLEIAK